MKHRPSRWLLAVTCLALLSHVHAADQVSITEFMAANQSTLADDDGDYSDWIEIHNDGGTPVNLGGWYLTDDAANLDQWRFPAVTLAPNAYLLVFASGKDRRTPGQTLHTNFKLDDAGEYLALVGPDLTVRFSFAPTYPAQVPDVAYGIPVRQSQTNLISAGALARVLVPTNDAAGTSWTTPEFDASSWMNLPTGVGYETDGLTPFTPVTIADSASDFSGIQGQDGWQYGYWNRKADLDGTYAANEFTPFPNSGPFGAGNFFNGAVWDWFNGDPPFTQISRDGARPSGSKGVPSQPDHWAIRRYICESNGPVRITGSLTHTSDWVYVTQTGIASSSLMYIYLLGTGDGYIDDIKLVAGSTPEVGANLVQNGDFETGVTTPFTISANLAGSSISSTVRRSGTRSLRLVSTSGGSSQGSSVWQTVNPAATAGSTYTLSYWYRPGTNSSQLVVRFSGGWINTTPVYCGDGVVGRILVDGQEVFQQRSFIANNDFNLVVPAQVGTRIDFALDPGSANDGDCDAARFSARIDTSDPNTVTVADTQADWSNSGVQGFRNWTYGYYNRSADATPPYHASNFVAFPRSAGAFGSNNYWNGAAWRWFNGNPPFDQISQSTMTPSGANSGADHWVIRRWVSEVAGTVTIDWSVLKSASGGNGVTGRLLQNGTQRDSVTVASSALSPAVRSVTLSGVQVGDIFDLALDSTGTDGTSEDTADTCTVTATVRGSPTLAGAIASNIESQMRNKNATAYLRLPFNVPDPAAYNFLALRLKHDDGYIAYLNGVQVASRNAPLVPAWNSAATTSRSDADALEFEEINLTQSLGLLHTGPNLLAIHGLNASAGDGDFLILPEIVASSVTADIDEHRYFAAPTPGTINGQGDTNLGPLVFTVAHTPKTPSDAQDLTVTAYIVPSFNPVGTVQLYYRVNYGAETPLTMFDDGVHGDGAAGDGIYGATVPASASIPGQMIRYYITARDNRNTLTRYPAFTDPLNSPQYLGTVVPNPSVNSPLPTMQMFVQNPTLATNYSGTRCSIFFFDEFHDNIEVSLHGQTTAAVFRNKSMNFGLNSGYKLNWSKDSPAVSDFDLLTTAPDKAYMRNILAFEAFAASGVPTHTCFPVRVQQNGAFYGVMHFVDNPEEEYLERAGLDPNGALYKVYLPLTNAYGGVVEKKTRKQENNDDLQALINGLRLTGNNLRNYLYDNVDIPEVINMLAAIQLIQNEDCCWYKNYYLYHDNDRTGEWQMHPWDLDLTYGRVFVAWQQTPQGIFGGYYDTNIYHTNLYYWQKRSTRDYIGNSQPLADALWNTAEIYEMFHRRWSTVADEFLQKPGTPVLQLRQEKRIDQLTTLLAGDAALDLARWGSWPYDAPVVQSLSQASTIIKTQWLARRRPWVFNDRAYTNDGSYLQPVSANAGLTFGAIEFNPSSRNQAQEYVQVRNPNSFSMDISGWQITGGIEHRFKAGTVLPANGSIYLSPNVKAFRARTVTPRGGQGLFVQGNYSGQLSARGESLQILDASGRVMQSTNYPGAPSPAQQYLRITEIMYHPAPSPGITADPDELEYIEVRNTGPLALDLRGVHFTNGLEYTFTTASLAPGARVVVVKNRAAFTNRFGASAVVDGVFSGSLDNSGERIELADASGEKILDFRYEDSWYPLTDGLGYSLVVVDDTAAWDTWGLKSQWRPSGSPDGSPGSGDIPLPTVAGILVNEVATHTTPPALDLIELHNPTTSAVNIGGWFLTDDFSAPKKYRIPNGSVIPARGFAVFTEADFNPGGTGFALSSDGDEVYLFSGDSTTNLTGYYHGFAFGAAAPDVSFGRHVNSLAEEQFVAQSVSTTGATNAAPRVGPVVVSEIMYHPPDLPGGFDNDRDEYIELENITGAPVTLFDPAAPTKTWRLRDAVDFNFPTNLTLPAGGRLLVVGFDPATNTTALNAFRNQYGLGAGVTILGPWDGKLDNDSDEIELHRPGTTVGGVTPYILVEQVHYRDIPTWPVQADGVGNSLQRTLVSGYGDEPLNWFAGGRTPGSNNVYNAAPVVSLIQPTNGAVLQLPVSMLLKASAVDPDGSITRVEFFDGTNKVGDLTAPPFEVPWSNSVAGQRILSVRARDNAGAVTVSAPVIVSLIPQPPAVTITSPTAGAFLSYGPTYTVTATASAGSQPIASVDILAGNTLLGSFVNPPYSAPWTPTPGSQSLRAIVTDVAGTTATSAVVNVTVVNAINTNILVVATNSVWRYHDRGQDLGSAWTQLAFDDSGWSNGCAQLGYGENDQCTTINFGGVTSNRFITYYFRQKFVVNSLFGVTNAVLRVLRDDGAIAYINGVEVFRSNMPLGPVNYRTPARAAVAGPDEGFLFPTNVTPELFVLGTNILTVEVHQNTNNSSDLSFAADLRFNSSIVGPGIVTHPLSRTNSPGQSATFTVVATGTAPLAYQWYHDGVAIGGATADTYQIASVSAASAGFYSVIVSNLAGTATSQEALLTVTGGDSDGDGLPDDWELANGLNPGINDADLDPDLDGHTNLQEYLAGTNPQDAGSVLRISSVVLDNGGTATVLQFTAVPNKAYTIIASPLVDGAPWTTVQAIAPSPATRTISVTNLITDPLQRFYRVATP